MAEEKGVNKSSAYEFYNKLGAPKWVVAPMVNQSELAFRMLCRRHGADLAYTPMIHSRMCMDREGFIDETFGTCKEDRPLIAQFCANKPELFLKAAKLVEGRCDGVDLNLGCPQGIAKRGHYGAFLLEESQLIREIVSTAHLHLNTPVTVKIRVLPKEEDTLALARLIQDAGAQILTVHGRTRDNMQHKIGACNFDIIRKVKQELKIPVFSNGGIEDYKDLQDCLKATNADGVMVSEALLENPMLFSGKVPDGIAIAEEYIECAKLYPCPLIERAMRPHMFKFLYRDLMKFTELRDSFHSMTREQLEGGPAMVRTRRELEGKRETEKAEGKCQLQVGAEKIVNAKEDIKDNSNRRDIEFRRSSWYRRHRTKMEDLELRRQERAAKRALEIEEAEDSDSVPSFSSDDEV